MPTARTGRSSRWMIFGLGLLLLLCLASLALVVAWRAIDRNASPSFGRTGRATATAQRGATRTTTQPSAGQQGARISNVATAEDLTNGTRPNGRTTEFRVGEEVYITYTATRVEAGQFVDLKILRQDGTVAYTDRNTFERVERYDGYFIFPANIAGFYRIELYFNGNATPSQAASFTVRER
jgi:hypothetical protein